MRGKLTWGEKYYFNKNGEYRSEINKARPLEHILKKPSEEDINYAKELPEKHKRFIVNCKNGTEFDKILSEEEIQEKLKLWDKDAEERRAPCVEKYVWVKKDVLPDDGWHTLTMGGTHRDICINTKSWERNKKYTHYFKPLRNKDLFKDTKGNIVLDGETNKPITIKLYSHKQEKYWQKKEKPASRPDPALGEGYSEGKWTHDYDESGNWEEKEPQTIETMAFQRFPEMYVYKTPKTQRNGKLIEKYNNRFWDCLKRGEIDASKAINRGLTKIHCLFCNKPWLIETAQSRYKHYSRYGKYCYPKLFDGYINGKRYNYTVPTLTVSWMKHNYIAPILTITWGQFSITAKKKEKSFLHRWGTPYYREWTPGEMKKYRKGVKEFNRIKEMAKSKLTPLQFDTFFMPLEIDLKAVDLARERGVSKQAVGDLISKAEKVIKDLLGSA